nr:MAG TPA: hypothetical protein [Caudoviricetes sp.]
MTIIYAKYVLESCMEQKENTTAITFKFIMRYRLTQTRI